MKMRIKLSKMRKKNKKAKSPKRLALRLEEICNNERNVNPMALKSTIELAIEIVREGWERRKIGTLFTVSDETNVLAASRSLILDPLKGHPPAEKRIEDPNMRETIKELAQLDGAFVVSDFSGFLQSHY